MVDQRYQGFMFFSSLFSAFCSIYFSIWEAYLEVTGWVTSQQWPGLHGKQHIHCEERILEKIWILKGETEGKNVNHIFQVPAQVLHQLWGTLPILQATLIISFLMFIWHIIHRSVIRIPTTHKSFHVGLLCADYLIYITVKLWNRYWHLFYLGKKKNSSDTLLSPNSLTSEFIFFVLY